MDQNHFKEGDYDNRTPLHLAASNGHLNVIKYLHENIPGLDINPVDRWDGTPYDDSLREQKDEVADYLESIGGCSGNELKRKLRLKEMRWKQMGEVKDDVLMQTAVSFMKEADYFVILVGEGLLNKDWCEVYGKSVEEFTEVQDQYTPNFGKEVC